MLYRILQEEPAGTFTDSGEVYDDGGNVGALLAHMASLQAQDGRCRSAAAVAPTLIEEAVRATAEAVGQATGEAPAALEPALEPAEAVTAAAVQEAPAAVVDVAAAVRHIL